MGTLRRHPHTKMKVEPLAVLKTALVELLNQHRDGAFQEDYDYLMGRLRANQWKSLLEWADAQTPIPPETDLTEYGPSRRYYVRREFAALFRKFQFTPEESGLDPEGKALAGFYISERRCRLVNRKLRLLLRQLRFERGGEVVEERYALYKFLDGARRWIKSVLGSRPVMDDIFQACDFGGGASIGVHGKATNIGRKILAEAWTCTPTCAPIAFEAMMSNQHLRAFLCPIGDGQELVARDTYYWSWVHRLRLIDYNKIEFVPKSAKTHRVIATEPLWNGFIQKGIDTVMKRLMAAHGIDLKYGWKQNQHWAYLGSLNAEGFATLDLSSASDSICTELVRFLLPPQWFLLLNNVRAPAYSLGGKVSRSEKFCSMGNGFCFPLETLIFAAFARQSCIERGDNPRYLIYGDDIIVKCSVVPTLIKRLESVGFRLNQEKSYWDGPFRESCGADWVRGRDVTPVYMRKRIDSLHQLIQFHNSLQTKCFGESFAFPTVTKALRMLVPSDYRYVELYRPGCKPLNTGFVVEIDEFMASPHIRWVPDTHHWEARGIYSEPCPDDFEHPLRNGVEYVAVLRGASSAAPLSLRRETKTRHGFYRGGSDYHMMVASRMYLPQFTAA